jgi:hypothetical protein
MITYRITKAKLDSAKKYREDFKNVNFHKFHRLYWIKKIKSDLVTNNIIVYWKFGMKSEYNFDNLVLYYLLRDCGFSDKDLELISNTQENK